MSYYIIRTLWKLMSLLPMGVLHFISDLIYFPLYYIARYRRKVVQPMPSPKRQKRRVYR